MNKRYVCGFDKSGLFQIACVYESEKSLLRPRLICDLVAITEVVDEEMLELYKKGYVRGSDGQPVAPVIPEPTPEEIAEQAMEEAKAERAAEVERLTVEVEGMVFDADETSQARMSVAASSMTDDETNVWVLHDNSVVQVTKAQLLLACRLARIAQSAVWTKPYENASA